MPGLFKQLHEVLKPGAKLLIAEPKGHVSKKDFDAFVEIAVQTGFRVNENLAIACSRGVVMEK